MSDRLISLRPEIQDRLGTHARRHVFGRGLFLHTVIMYMCLRMVEAISAGREILAFGFPPTLHPRLNSVNTFARSTSQLAGSDRINSNKVCICFELHYVAVQDALSISRVWIPLPNAGGGGYIWLFGVVSHDFDVHFDLFLGSGFRTQRVSEWHGVGGELWWISRSRGAMVARQSANRTLGQRAPSVSLNPKPFVESVGATAAA